MIITFFGDGKGKTSAALGVALRAAGWKKRVKIYQFIKSEDNITGELLKSKEIDEIKIIQGGQGFVGIEGDKKDISEHSDSAKKLLSKIEFDMKAKNTDIVIFDEILVAIDLGLITQRSAVNIIKKYGNDLDVIVTGRPKNEEVIKISDMVSEIKPIKHPFDKGITAKKGIDW